MLLCLAVAQTSFSQNYKVDVEIGLNASYQSYERNTFTNGAGYYSSLSPNDNGFVNGMNFQFSRTKIKNINLVPNLAIYFPIKKTAIYSFGIKTSMGLGYSFLNKTEYDDLIYIDFKDVDTLKINKISTEIGLGLYLKYDLAKIFISECDLLVSVGYYRSSNIVKYFHPRVSIGLVLNDFSCQLYTNLYKLRTNYDLVDGTKVQAALYSDVFGVSLGYYLKNN